MKKHLLPPTQKYFKANLHTHTIVSDGVMTPQEVRDLYKAEGYSILAITDHSVMVEHQDLNQEDFLILTGVEIDVDDRMSPDQDVRKRNRHFCLISKDPHRQWIPYRDPEPKPSSIPYEATNEIAGMPQIYDAEHINAVIAECNRQGNLVIYNHPCWSLESYPEYSPMKGLWGMEYRNSGSISLGYDENNSQIYQDLLKLGNRLVPVAADDMHRTHRNGMKILGNSWTMIGAEKLTYDSVIRAMEEMAVYASCGPQIHSLTWEDGMLEIECSPCQRIQVITQTRVAHLAIADGGQTITGAQFDMNRWLTRSQGKENCFFRLVVTAPDGTYAVTRAYWLDKL